MSNTLTSHSANRVSASSVQLKACVRRARQKTSFQSAGRAYTNKKYSDVDNVSALRVQFMAHDEQGIQSKAEAFQYIPSHNRQWQSIRGSFLFTILVTHSDQKIKPIKRSNRSKDQNKHEATRPFDLIVHIRTRQISKNIRAL
jgi:hypothetical protein